MPYAEPLVCNRIVKSARRKHIPQRPYEDIGRKLQAHVEWDIKEERDSFLKTETLVLSAAKDLHNQTFDDKYVMTFIKHITALAFVSLTISSQAQTSTIQIKALVGLKYDITSFNVKPGADVTLTLNNVSDMAHN